MARKSIIGVKDCYGCGVCTKVCPKKIIHLSFNKKGFYEPTIIDESQCTHCGMCLKVCAHSYDNLSNVPTEVKSFAGWSNNQEVRRSCSSGGVAYEVSKLLIQRGYKVVAVRYDSSKDIVEHYISSTLEELESSKGSKYLQSNTEQALKAIDKSGKYLVTGTPCQIDSFRRYIKLTKCEHNFILLDFFCHGVPSRLMWEKYIREKKDKIGNIRSLSWRNKSTGWQDSYNINIVGDNTILESRLSKGDEFYKLFLSDVCLGKACYKTCKYKLEKSSADIRVGDLWGREYRNNEQGVSAVVAYNKLGLDLLTDIDCTLIPHSFDIVSEDQTRINPRQTIISHIISFSLRFDFVSCKMILNQLYFLRIIRSILIHIINPRITVLYFKNKLFK